LSLSTEASPCSCGGAIIVPTTVKGLFINRLLTIINIKFMKKMNKKSGFTLIELLVVIAIIGILSSVVLVSLNSARGKGNDAKIQGQISQFRAGAELYAGNHNSSYTGMDAAASTDASGLYQLEQASNWPGSSAPIVKVGSTGITWVVYHQLNSNSALYACADSSGAATTTANVSTTKLCDNTTAL
jgi:prepilin-type N-terminal cleavage/methylation domain-containing protein